MKNTKALFVLAASLLLCSCGGNTPSSAPSSEAPSSPSSVPTSIPSVATYVVTLTPGEHYTIAPVSGYDPSSVEEGASFKFTVTPATNYKIVEVKAGETVLISSNGTYTIPRISENTTVTVEVAVETIAITLPSGTGYRCEAVEGYNPSEVAKGGDFKFKVIAESHYEIKSVKAGEVVLEGNEGVYTISEVTGPVEISVEAEEETHGLTLTQGEKYTINVLTEGIDLTKIAYSQEVRIKVTPTEGNHIKSVLLNGQALTEIEGVYTISHLEQDSVVTVEIAANIFSVSLPAGEHYTITAKEGYDASNVKWGEDFKFSVAVDEHYHLSSVKAGTVELTPEGNEYTISDIKDNVVVTVEVAEDTYAITLPSARYYDIDVLTTDVNLANVPYSKAVRFSVTPKSHCQVLSVKIGDEVLTAVDGVYTIQNRVADVTVSIEATIDTYSVSLPTSEHYTVAAVEGNDPTKVEYGADFSFTVTPAESYRIVSVKAGEDVLTAVEGVYTIVNVTENKTVEIEEEFIHEHSYDKYGSCNICGKMNLIATVNDQSKLSKVSEMPEGVELPSQFENLYLYEKGGYFNGTTIFSKFNISEFESISFYVANKGLDNNGKNYSFYLNEADPNVSSSVNKVSGLGNGVCGTVTITQTGDGEWTFRTDATDVYGRKGFFSDADWQPHDVELVYNDIWTLDELLKFSSWDWSVYISDINVTMKNSDNLGFPSADKTKTTEESPEGVACSKSFGTMHKFNKGGYFDAYQVFEDVDISEYTALKFLVSNNGVDNSGNQQHLFIADAGINVSPKYTGINKGYTVAVYAKKDSTGSWSLTCDQADQYDRKGFISTSDYAPHAEPVIIGEAAKLNDLIKISTWVYSFYMSDITAYK